MTVRKYLDMDYADSGNSCYAFFGRKKALDLLFEPALIAFSELESSVPVEHIFSYGGLVLTPHCC